MRNDQFRLASVPCILCIFLYMSYVVTCIPYSYSKYLRMDLKFLQFLSMFYEIIILISSSQADSFQEKNEKHYKYLPFFYIQLKRSTLNETSQSFLIYFGFFIRFLKEAKQDACNLLSV